MKRVGAWVLVAGLAIGFGLSGCRESSSERSLRSLIDGSTPVGYRVGPSDANGPLSRDDAAHSTPLPPEDMKEFLRDHHFEAGYARVWTSGKAFFVSTVFQFRGAADANTVVPFVKSGFARLTPAYIESYPRIPGGLRYDFNVRKPNGVYQICTGVMFQVAKDVHLVSACDDNPPDRPLVEQRAVAQYERARRLVHPTDSSTGPKAGTPMSSSSTTLQNGSAP